MFKVLDYLSSIIVSADMTYMQFNILRHAPYRYYFDVLVAKRNTTTVRPDYYL